MWKRSKKQPQPSVADLEHQRVLWKFHTSFYIPIDVWRASNLTDFERKVNNERIDTEGMHCIDGTLAELDNLRHPIISYINFNRINNRTDSLEGLGRFVLIMAGDDDRELRILGDIMDVGGRIYREIVSALRDAALSGNNPVMVKFETDQTVRSEAQVEELKASLRERPTGWPVPIYGVQVERQISVPGAPEDVKQRYL